MVTVNVNHQFNWPQSTLHPNGERDRQFDSGAYLEHRTLTVPSYRRYGEGLTCALALACLSVAIFTRGKINFDGKNDVNDIDL